VGARRYRVAVGAAMVVAVLEWCRMRGVRAVSDMSDGWCWVGLDVGVRQMWCRAGSGRGGVKVGVGCVGCGGAGAANVVLERWQT